MALYWHVEAIQSLPLSGGPWLQLVVRLQLVKASRTGTGRAERTEIWPVRLHTEGRSL